MRRSSDGLCPESFSNCDPSTFGRLLFGAILLTLASAVAVAQAPTAAAPKLKGVWEPVNYTEDISLTDVFFVTADVGYVAGAAGTILKTTDAGASWTALLGGDPQSQERAIKQLWFVTPEVGWATQVTGTGTHLFHTTDGDTWTRIGNIPEHYEDYAFANEREGLYVNDAEVFRTQDAGKTWRKTYQCAAKAQIGGLMRQVSCDIWKIRFVSPTLVYALGAAIEVTAALVLKSEDAGATWSVVSLLEEESAGEGGLFFLDERTGYFSTKYAKALYRTTDGGATWVGMPATATARRIIFADPAVGWALHYNTLSYTTDGGKRWFSREIPFPAMPNAFSLPRRDRAYAVGEHGMVYRYSVMPESAAVAARSLASPAMPGIDNAVLAQIQQLETRLGKIDALIGKAGGHAGGAPGGVAGGTTDDAANGSGDASGGAAEGASGGGTGGAAGGDWSDASVDQQLAQLQGTIDAVATGVPAMGSKHRNLNLAMFGLQLLGDLSGQAGGLKEAFAGLRQSKDLATASTSLQGLHAQLDAMKTSVEAFRTSKKSGS